MQSARALSISSGLGQGLCWRTSWRVTTLSPPIEAGQHFLLLVRGLHVLQRVVLQGGSARDGRNRTA